LLRRVAATRYVTPLREGGSLPAIVDADDGNSYVVKFRGAGQGKKVLVAEVIVGELARRLGLRVPELVLVEVDPLLGRSEPDYEIRTLLQHSGGLNLGLRYLPSALGFEPALAPPPDAELAARIVWLDALCTNVDRTPRNTNLLLWKSDLWLIDHGASLYFHHDWAGDWLARAAAPFPLVRDHVLLRLASDLRGADAQLAPIVNEETLQALLEAVPDDWLDPDPAIGDSSQLRSAYRRWFAARLAPPRRWLEEAERVRTTNL
jgi:hypothetical protein